jgi:outer membrane protein
LFDNNGIKAYFAKKMGMKNVSLVLNAVLLVAVAVLFYLHFSSKNTSAPVVKSSDRLDSSQSGFRIAYFEMDSITNSLSLVKEVKDELAREEDRMNAEMSRLQKSYNDKLAYYQNQGEMSAVQSEEARRDMLNMQDQIGRRKQQMDQDYQNMYMQKMQDVKSKIENFLKDYNKNLRYSYIITNEPGFIYYRDTVYNITADVLKGLNEKHPPKKSK